MKMYHQNKNNRVRYMQHAAVALARYCYVIGSSSCYGRSRELKSARHFADEAWPFASYITRTASEHSWRPCYRIPRFGLSYSFIEIDGSIQEPFDDLTPRTRLIDESQEKLSCAQKTCLMSHVQ